MSEFRSFDEYMQQNLQNPAETIAYLEAALESFEEDNNMEAFLLALKRVVEVKGGITKLARETNLNRQNLYKVFSNKVDPRFSTINTILQHLGLRFSLKAS
jgi:probable addiction module antidote protein